MLNVLIFIALIFECLNGTDLDNAESNIKIYEHENSRI